MRSKEADIKCKYRFATKCEKDILTNIIMCYTSPDKVLKSFKIIVVESRKGLEYLLVPEELVQLLTTLRKICERIYTIGLHVATLTHDGKLKLHLSLGVLIEHAIERGYVIVDCEGEKHITYGREVLQEHVIKISHPPDNHCRYAVLNLEHRFLAWAVLEKRKDKFIVKPVIDVGWYLRSGV